MLNNNQSQEPKRGGRIIMKAEPKSKQDAITVVLPDDLKAQAATLASLAEITRSEAIRQLMVLGAQSSKTTAIDLVLSRDQLRTELGEALKDMYANGKRAAWLKLPVGAIIKGVKYVRIDRYRLQSDLMNFGGFLVLEVASGDGEEASGLVYYEFGAYLYPGLELVIKALKKRGDGVRQIEPVVTGSGEDAENEDQLGVDGQNEGPDVAIDHQGVDDVEVDHGFESPDGLVD